MKTHLSLILTSVLTITAILFPGCATRNGHSPAYAACASDLENERANKFAREHERRQALENSRAYETESAIKTEKAEDRYTTVQANKVYRVEHLEKSARTSADHEYVVADHKSEVEVAAFEKPRPSGSKDLDRPIIKPAPKLSAPKSAAKPAPKPVGEKLAKAGPKPERAPAADTPPKNPDGSVYPVWFGTNRKPIAGQNGIVFTTNLHDRITYGRVDVFVPKTHRFGETGSPFWKRLLRGEFQEDKLVMKDVRLQQHNIFYDEIRQTIADAIADGNKSQALVFLHGFNVTFEEAAIRAAQVGFDLKLPGPTAFFSWPSWGSATLGAYHADEEAIRNSEAAIADFLVEFTRKSGATNLNLIAHSMGNRGLLSALQRIAARAELRSQIRFDQVFLAAPDVSRKDFLEVSEVCTKFSKRTTLYTSKDDLPVYLSTIINRGPRAGYFKPYTVAPGVDTIAVPDFNIDLLGHSYFAEAEALLYDIRNLILHDEAPNKRARISPTTEDGSIFWQLRR